MVRISWMAARVYRLLRRHTSTLAIRILATLSSKWKRLKSAVRDSVLGQRKFWQFHIVVWQSTVKKGTKRTCWAIVPPIKSFVLPRPCCCRQVPDIKMHVGTPLAFQFVSLVLRGLAKPYRWRYFVNCRSHFFLNVIGAWFVMKQKTILSQKFYSVSD